MSGSPEELLRSALEKVIFFECRVASLESELDAARAASARAREEAGASRRREGELETALVQVRGEHAMAIAHNAELMERVRILEAERDRFLTGMVERARVAGAPAEEDGEAGTESDLAGFIAELRAEIDVLRAWKAGAVAAGYDAAAATPSPATLPPSALTLRPEAEDGGGTPLRGGRDERPRVEAHLVETLSTSTSTSTSTPTSTSTSTSTSTPTSTSTSASTKTATPAAPPPTTPSGAPRAETLSALAARLEESGRIHVSAADARSLPSFVTRSERALYERSLDDLSSADPARRRRAADGLRTLASRAAAPLVAAALGREHDADAKLALLAALGSLGEAGSADLALRELSDPRPAVRAGALDAAAALLRGDAIACLARALADASPLVRRRAVVLLGFTRGGDADEALASALADRDAGVARMAAVALSGRPSARAQGALVRALDHGREDVRAAAGRAVGRWSGEAVDATAPEAERRRTARRISEKLLELDGAKLREAVTRVPASATAPPVPAPLVRTAAPRRQAPSALSAASASERSRSAPVGRSAPRSAPAPHTPSAASAGEPGGSTPLSPAAALATAVATVDPDGDPALADAALAEVRAALRGRTAAELAAALGRDRAAVEGTLRALVGRGQLAARGPRFFLA